MSCGVPGHWKSAARKGDRDLCEVQQHQVITKGIKMGHQLCSGAELDPGLGAAWRRRGILNGGAGSRGGRRSARTQPVLIELSSGNREN